MQKIWKPDPDSCKNTGSDRIWIRIRNPACEYMKIGRRANGSEVVAENEDIIPWQVPVYFCLHDFCRPELQGRLRYRPRRHNIYSVRKKMFIVCMIIWIQSNLVYCTATVPVYRECFSSWYCTVLILSTLKLSTTSYFHFFLNCTAPILHLSSLPFDFN